MARWKNRLEPLHKYSHSRTTCSPQNLACLIQVRFSFSHAGTDSADCVVCRDLPAVATTKRKYRQGWGCLLLLESMSLDCEALALPNVDSKNFEKGQTEMCGFGGGCGMCVWGRRMERSKAATGYTVRSHLKKGERVGSIYFFLSLGWTIS